MCELLQLSRHFLSLGPGSPLYPTAETQPAPELSGVQNLKKSFWTPDIFTVFISKILFFWEITPRSEVNGSRCFEAK
jgi:hypothetical protein